MKTGILSWGAYLPRRRLARAAIAHALAWRAQEQKKPPAGERAYGNWDEDSLTMAVEAARDALRGGGVGASPGALHLASTTLPFADRSNSGLVADALSLANPLATQDATGSQRAGTSLLLQALSGHGARPATLVAAADRRRTRAGSPEEQAYGDGASAVLVGQGTLAAEFLGGTSVATDFVDHYRESSAEHDYTLEERWIRTEGHQKLIPAAIAALLTELHLSPDAVRHFVFAAPFAAALQVARVAGLAAETVTDAKLERCGHTGTAHPLLMLGAVLDTAGPDELILLVGFGQGVDVLALRTTAALSTVVARGAVDRALAAGRTDNAYVRFLSHGGALDMDWGMRAERDSRTAQSSHYRKHRDLNGFVGGRCRACGAVQFPRSRACVNPQCRAFDTQAEYVLAQSLGRVKTYTEDWLAFVPEPPLQYGNVNFSEGGNVFIEFTDVEPGELSVGATVRFVFRIKDVDHVRGFHRYFWKATLVRN